MVLCFLSVASQKTLEWEHAETGERPSFSLSHLGPRAGETCIEGVVTGGDLKARNSSGFSGVLASGLRLLLSRD